MSDLAIRVVDLGKQYRIGEWANSYHTFRDILAGTVSASFRRISRSLRGDREPNVEQTI